MIVELVAAIGLGAFVLWFLLTPFSGRRVPAPIPDPPIPEETARGQALIALRDLDFERETGKLSDADYAELKAKYKQEALALLDADPVDPAEALVLARRQARLENDAPSASPSCPYCGDRPESDARFCSSCGGSLDRSICGGCGGRIEIGDRFCRDCGRGVRA